MVIGEVIYYSMPALFRVRTNVTLVDLAAGASHQITFKNERAETQRVLVSHKLTSYFFSHDL